ncbi:TctA family transporter [Bradyrhizobium sp. LM6.10]
MLNVPLIGLWVKLLMIPYKYLYPSALFFVAIGVYSTNSDMFQVGETVVAGLIGYLLLLLDFHPRPRSLLGFVPGPRLEENFRRSLLVSRGDAMIFVERPISAFFLFLCVMLLAAQVYVRLRKPKVLAALDVAEGNGVATARPAE